MLPIYSTSRLITKLTSRFGRNWLTYPQYLVLMVLWETDEISVNRISQKLLLNTNTLSPLLKRIEKMELLSRSRSSQDERSVIIALTEKGKQLKNAARPIPQKLIQTLLDENIQLADVLQLKETLNTWIKILAAKTKNTD